MRDSPKVGAPVFDGSLPPYLPPEIALTTVAERDAYLRTRNAQRKRVWNYDTCQSEKSFVR
jgi:hypothetical protein